MLTRSQRLTGMDAPWCPRRDATDHVFLRTGRDSRSRPAHEGPSLPIGMIRAAGSVMGVLRPGYRDRRFRRTGVLTDFVDPMAIGLASLTTRHAAPVGSGRNEPSDVDLSTRGRPRSARGREAFGRSGISMFPDNFIRL